MLLDELLIKIGFDVDSAQLNQVGQMLNNVGETAKKAFDNLRSEKIDVDFHSLNQVEQTLNNIGDSVKQAFDGIDLGDVNIDTLTEQVEQAFDDVSDHIKTGMVSISDFIDTTTAKELFGDQFETATTELDEFVQQLLQLSNIDEINTDEIQAFVDKVAEFDEFIAQFGEDTQAYFAELSDGFHQTSETYQQGLAKVAQQENQFSNATEQANDALKHQEEQANNTHDALAKTGNVFHDLLGSVSAFIGAKFGIQIDSEPFKKLGKAIKDSQEKAKSFLGSVKGIPVALGLVGTAVGAVVKGLSAFVDNTLTSLDSLAQLSRVSGVSAGYIQSLGEAAKRSGSSMEAAQSSIAGLQRTLGEALNGVGRGAKTFEQFGIAAKDASGKAKTMPEVMEEIQGKIEKLDRTQGVAMLQKLGMDASMIQLFDQNSEDFKAAIARANDITLGSGKYAEDAAGFKDALSEFNTLSKSLSETLAGRLAPVLTRIYTGITNWFLRNKWLVVGVEALGDAIAGAIDFIRLTFDVIDTIIDKTIGWKAALFILGGVVAWFSRGAIMWFGRMAIAFMSTPIGWLMAGIAALVLLFDDLFTYMNHGESLFGHYWDPVIDGIRWVKKFIKELPDYFKKFTDMWTKWKTEIIVGTTIFTALFHSSLFSMVKAVLKFTTTSKVIGSLFSGFGRVISFFFGIFKGGFGLVFGLAGKFIGIIRAVGLAIRAAFMSNPIGLIITAITLLAYVIYENWDKIKKWTGDLWDSLGGWFSKIGTDIKNFADNAKKSITEKFEQAFDWVKKQYDKYIKPIVDVVSGMWDSTKGAVSHAWDGAKNMASGAWDSFTGFLGGGNNAQQTLATASTIANGSANMAMQSGVTNTQNKTDNSQKNSNNKITVNNTFSTNNQSEAKAVADQSLRILQNMNSAYSH
ncbi:hypothetical protein [Lonepinella koalarum]|uniref:hypothetical protein n=1 Tax=Lonepinella koalarum TaxID=53417 RepID=UPI003F6DF07F